MMVVEHGGPDGGAPITHDFSTNANPLGPPIEVATALHEARRASYPDPRYRAVRERLAHWHGVEPTRVLPTAGTSEAIRRLTLAAWLQGVRTVWAPRPGYADYAAAARALGLAVREFATAEALVVGLLAGLQDGEHAALVWLCEPCNPTGRSLPPAVWADLAALVAQGPHTWALDRAYEALRLRGTDPVPPTLAERAWQCHSPNKSLGLTGVRAGYLVAPPSDEARLAARMEALAPSWVLSAEGVALLEAWPWPATQAWLAMARRRLAQWAGEQRELLSGLGWQQASSVTNFWLARPGEQGAAWHERLQALRSQGIKLRDAASLGLPGWVRVSVQAPAAQQALVEAWGPPSNLAPGPDAVSGLRGAEEAR